MSPESPSSVVVLDLKWNSSQLESIVDRYDVESFLHVSWDAIECPENYQVIGNSVAFAWLPPNSKHRHYRARIPAFGKSGFGWRDRAFGIGAMVIVKLPSDHVFIYSNKKHKFPVDVKMTNDERMALYWWVEPGRFEIKWQMQQFEKEKISGYCDQIKEEAWTRSTEDDKPPHFERDYQNHPSHEPQFTHEPPNWHKGIELPQLSTLITETFNLSEVNDLCFRLNINSDEISGNTITEKANALISHCSRRNLLQDLVSKCRELRPNSDWPIMK